MQHLNDKVAAIAATVAVIFVATVARTKWLQRSWLQQLRPVFAISLITCSNISYHCLYRVVQKKGPSCSL